MNLVIFDIDGTLTKSSQVDLASFVYLITKALGAQHVSTNLADYEHATASFIYRHYFHQRHQRNPRPEELEVAQRRHATLIQQAIQAKPDCISAVPGAGAMLALLREREDWQVSIATGAWRAPALAKLAHAGLDAGWIPAAFAEDGFSREGIIGRARERALAAAKVVSFDRIVLVGDGVWDVQAARQLGYGFVGITHDADAALLRRQGARVLLPDYSRPELILRALTAAENRLETAAV